MLVKLDGKTVFYQERIERGKNMKKKLAALMIGVMAVTAAAGCGAGKGGGVAEGTELVETTEAGEVQPDVTAASSAFDLKGSDYVKLGDYSKIEVTITGDYEVDDADVTAYFEQMFQQYGPFYTEKEGPVEDGDAANVNYVGKLDGVAFEGGSAENQMIDVYNNTSVSGSGYIKGFSDGLKGAKAGDVIDWDVTFPEDYGNADLAGKAVVFTFTVNSVQRPISIDEVDDNFAREQFEADTVEEMYAQIRTFMEQSAASSKEEASYKAVQQYLLENSSAEVPEDYLAARVSDYKRQFIQNYCDGDESKLEEYISTYFGKTVEEAEAEWSEGMKQGISLELIMDAIADDLGIELDEEGYSARVQEIIAGAGYTSEDTLYRQYGFGDAAYGEKYFRDIYRYDTALEKLMETATVNVAEAAPTGAADGTEATDGTKTAE